MTGNLRAASALADRGYQTRAKVLHCCLSPLNFNNSTRPNEKSGDGKMQIILQEEVEKLGDARPGGRSSRRLRRVISFCRGKLALEATPGNMKRLEKMRVTFAKKEATEKKDAQTLAELLAGVSP